MSKECKKCHILFFPIESTHQYCYECHECHSLPRRLNDHMSDIICLRCNKNKTRKCITCGHPKCVCYNCCTIKFEADYCGECI